MCVERAKEKEAGDSSRLCCTIVTVDLLRESYFSLEAEELHREWTA